MSLDLDRLEKPRMGAGKVIARCPACAEVGADRACEHLFVADEGCGPFGCIAHTGPDGEAHRKRIWELAGKIKRPGQSLPLLPRLGIMRKPVPRFPPLRKLAVGEMAAVAELRGWRSFAGLELLSRRRLLWYADVFDYDSEEHTRGEEWPAWLIADSTRRNAQARRLDGQSWHGIGDKKAKTLPGSDPSWPIGAAEIGDNPFVALCEGQPDFCAALFVAWFEGLTVERVAPVCITGAGNSIHADALPLFAGRHVRIAVHADKEGREAGERWARELHHAGASCVDGFHFDRLIMPNGCAVKDLADYATLLDFERPPRVRVFADFG